jgi:hypothetical protein
LAAIAAPLVVEDGFSLDPTTIFTTETNSSYYFTPGIAFFYGQSLILESMSLLFIGYKII